MILKRYFVLFQFLLLIFCFSFFCKPQSTDYSFLSYLGLANQGSYINGIFYPSTNPFVIGDMSHLNGLSGGDTGTVVSATGDDSTLGISTRNNGVADIIFLFDEKGIPFAIDTDGNGVADYYICYKSTKDYYLTTGSRCTGNAVTVIVGQGYDTNGDGVADNPILSQIASDSNPPNSVISPSPGIYGSSTELTIACNDSVAPGNIVYTIDSSTPSFEPIQGSISNPKLKKFTLGSSDGTYTVKYRCRDLAGNVENVHTDPYEFNHNVPTVTISNLNSSGVSSLTGAIGTASFNWSSNYSGSYSIRLNASNCQSGTILQSGNVIANIINSFSISATSFNIGPNTIFVCARAALTGYQTLAIVRDESQPSIIPNPGGGNYGKAQSVNFSCLDNNPLGCGKIAYTLDGSDPNINASNGTILNGIEFQNPISIPVNSAVTLKFIGADLAGNLSPVQSAAYFITTQVATVTTNSFTPVSRVVNATSDQSVTWVSDRNGVFTIRSGANCDFGTILSGTNVAGSVTAGVPVTSTILNSNFVSGANSILICVANAALDPLYGNTSFTITKDNTRPTVSSTNPVDFNIATPVFVTPSPGRIQIVFSKNMDTSFGGISSGSKIKNVCYPIPTNPPLTISVFDGVSWDCIDFTATYTWVSATTLQIDLSWIRFPENAKVTWTLSKDVLRDVAGNTPLNDVQGTFFTAQRQEFFKPFKTDQTSCWDTSGNLVPCAGSNQDGQNQYGMVRSYTVRYYSGFANDAVTEDNTSGLKWKTCSEGKISALNSGVTSCVDIVTPSANCSPKDSSNQPVRLEYWPFYSFQDNSNQVYPSSVNGCSYLNECNAGAGFAGITNWRLPTQRELDTLSVFGYSSGNAAFPSQGFPDPIANYFWSSTLRKSNPFYAWGVNFNYGASDVYVRSNTNNIRCVSGAGTQSQTFTDLGNETILDNTSNLVWQKCSAGLSGNTCNTGTATKPTWSVAISYCSSLSLAGRSWRLPNIKELNSIVDMSSASSIVTIDPVLFPNTKNAGYWSSSSYAPSPSNAWIAYFPTGGMSPFTGKSNTAYIRCVANGP
ncbi:DUF1566 domain-containing protein [Leptospira interrogans]|uniref:PF07603 family protein n=8 Tax=Leptospira interrogans TaxID=173 RepID=Q8EZX0_LEPIN|nr:MULTISPECIES: DUF1566 domain-containing protein [Leptospira]EMF41118.1 PF07603 family protein [Leptospira interrogans serovar Lora str. TE 1992]EMF71401.1 PF07603 family protein [Leptospira interrogans serovar Canicola str. LT1962]AAN50929.2 hypothetical protein LA_3731 [Leptospira interrogans serovar Lai str. 56601]AER03763.1 hypothetical protein LIF_A2992 [Leptospira interrogans serovar Lai str. IPAV]AJR13106.1 hypothetical protein LIL_10504 [Leptospira interrogans serovar Linhai str. 566